MAGKSVISDAVAMKQLAKILRSNVVTSVVTVSVFSVPDTYNIFRKRLFSAQYTKDILSLIDTMLSAGGGTVATSLSEIDLVYLKQNHKIFLISFGNSQMKTMRNKEKLMI